MAFTKILDSDYVTVIFFDVTDFYWLGLAVLGLYGRLFEGVAQEFPGDADNYG